MTTIDTVRIIALLPLRDFENTTEYARRAHRFFNIGFSLITILLMILLPLTQFKGFHSILDLGDLLFWVFVPLTGMWGVGYQLQLLQSRDECNQPQSHTPVLNTIEPVEDSTHSVDSKESRGPGRPRCAQFDQSVGPLNDDIAIASLEDEMGSYADKELGSLEGRYIIDALNSSPYHFTHGEYSIQNLATWLFDSFRPKFRASLKSGNAMTTIKSERYNNDDAKKVKDRLNNKYLQLEKMQKKE